MPMMDLIFEGASGIPLGYAPWPGQSEQDPAYRALELARRAVEGFVAKERTVRNDTRLSGVGQREALTAAGQEFDGLLREAGEALEVARRQAAEVEGRLGGVAPPADVLEQARFMKVWDWFMDRNEFDRAGAITAAIAAGDTELLRAVLDAPRAFGLVPEETRGRIREALVQLVAPAEFRRWQGQVAQVQAATLALELAARRIREAPSLTDRQVRERDEGEAVHRRTRAAA